MISIDLEARDVVRGSSAARAIGVALGWWEPVREPDVEADFAVCSLRVVGRYGAAGGRKNADVVGWDDLAPHEALFAGVGAEWPAIGFTPAGGERVVRCGECTGRREDADVVIGNSVAPNIALQAGIRAKVTSSKNTTPTSDEKGQ